MYVKVNTDTQMKRQILSNPRQITEEFTSAKVHSFPLAMISAIL